MRDKLSHHVLIFFQVQCLLRKKSFVKVVNQVEVSKKSESCI